MSEADFADYTHALSKARILKAQHPDYEISQMGIHAQRGVSCADCHMPTKVREHEVQRSPYSKSVGYDRPDLPGVS